VLRGVRRTAQGPVIAPGRVGSVSQSRRRLAARVPLSAAGLRAGELRWWVTAWWPGSECPRSECQELVPPPAGGSLRLRTPRLTGCSGRGSWFRRHGSRHRRAVSLTFDDGPSAYTAKVMRILARANARATFYVLGSQVAQREALLRRMLRQGNEIADHSWSHPTLPSYSQIHSTSVRIRRATGFRPCLFRPPAGPVNARLVANARRAGMRTIAWDVDPKDWSTPGAGTIVRRVVNHVRPGSIVVMHDGGGSRAQTVAALPSILRRLRHRGYRFVTTTELLGGRPRWRPR